MLPRTEKSLGFSGTALLLAKVLLVKSSREQSTPRWPDRTICFLGNSKSTRPLDLLPLALSHTKEMWGAGALRVSPLLFSTFYSIFYYNISNLQKNRETGTTATTPI